MDGFKVWLAMPVNNSTQIRAGQPYAFGKMCLPELLRLKVFPKVHASEFAKLANACPPLFAKSVVDAHCRVGNLSTMATFTEPRIFVREWRLHRQFKTARALIKAARERGIMINSTMISRMENNRRDYKTFQLDMVARALKCSTVALYFHPSAFEHEVLDLVGKMPDEEKPRAKAILELLLKESRVP